MQNPIKYFNFIVLSAYILTVIVPPNGFNTFEGNKDKYVTPNRIRFVIAMGCLFPFLMLLSFYVDKKNPFFNETSMNGDMDIINYLGMSICIVGVTLRRIAFRILDKFFTYNVTIQKDHKLLKDGPYRYIRHPSYTGMALAYLGYMMFLKCNLIGLLIFAFPMLLFLVLRIRNEEEELTNHFKNDYLQYKKETWALIPFIY